jgi:hypothetical protein
MDSSPALLFIQRHSLPCLAALLLRIVDGRDLGTEYAGRPVRGVVRGPQFFTLA